MDESESTTLVAALSASPDPRCRRGRCYGWGQLLTLIAAALVSGECDGRGIGQWVREHAEELRQRISLARVPCEATLRRVLQQVDPAQLESRVAALAAGEPRPESSEIVGLAVDGKEVRGSGHHGAPCFLVGLVRHDGIENRVHYVRDVTFREDAGQAHTGYTVEALAALRNAILNRLRQHGWDRIPDALRHYPAHLDEALSLIGACS